MKVIRIGAAFAAVCLMLAIFTTHLQAQNAFYVEETKDGRIYVFNNPKAYTDWKASGEMGKSITRIGAGPNGETIVFDSEEALHLYNFKHNIPGEVLTTTTTPPPAMQEKLPYKFSGYMFGDYFYNTSRDPLFATATPPSNAALGGPEKLNGFQFRRIYFTFDDDIADNFTTRFRLEADQAALSSDGKISVFVKDAYLRWKNVFGNSDFIFGIQPTPAYVDYSESVWYRSLEKTIMDLRGILGSRDIGVSLRGKLDPAGKFNYWVEVGNGSGNKPETDKFKRAMFNFQWKPTDKFYATVYQDYKAAPDIADPINAGSTIGNNSYTTYVSAIDTVKDKYAVGGEAFFTRTQNGTLHALPTPSLDSKTTDGFSGWGWYYPNSKVGFIGRFDHFDPNTAKDFKGDARDLFVGGLILKPHKNIYIMPNVEVESFQKSATGVKLDTSVTPRITFYYVFL
jgi:hypothetical protein